jgi:hypothetical protein
MGLLQAPGAHAAPQALEPRYLPLLRLLLLSIEFHFQPGVRPLGPTLDFLIILGAGDKPGPNMTLAEMQLPAVSFPTHVMHVPVGVVQVRQGTHMNAHISIRCSPCTSVLGQQAHQLHAT